MSYTNNALIRICRATSMGISFLAGGIWGYSQEKLETPVSASDLSLQFGVPAFIHSMQYLALERRIMDFEGFENKIAIGNVGAVGTFVTGNGVGRYLARVL